MPRYLVAQSELPDERAKRRARAGKSAGETYRATLRQLRPDADVRIASPSDDGAPTFSVEDIAYFDAVFLTGSPMHAYEQTSEVERQLDFMRTVFMSGVPGFGSCAGLQVAVAAAGGKVRKMPRRMEAGIARRITATSQDAGIRYWLGDRRAGMRRPSTGTRWRSCRPARRCSPPTA